MATRKSKAVKSKSQKKRSRSVVGKTKSTRVRRSAVQKSSKAAKGGPEAELKGPKKETSGAAHHAGKLLKKIGRAATIKEAKDLVRKIRNLGTSSKNQDWWAKARKARDRRIKTLRQRTAKRKQIKATNPSFGSGRKRNSRGKRRTRRRGH